MVGWLTGCGALGSKVSAAGRAGCGGLTCSTLDGDLLSGRGAFACDVVWGGWPTGCGGFPCSVLNGALLTAGGAVLLGGLLAGCGGLGCDVIAGDQMPGRGTLTCAVLLGGLLKAQPAAGVGGEIARLFESRPSVPNPSVFSSVRFRPVICSIAPALGVVVGVGAGAGLTGFVDPKPATAWLAPAALGTPRLGVVALGAVVLVDGVVAVVVAGAGARAKGAGGAEGAFGVTALSNAAPAGVVAFVTAEGAAEAVGAAMALDGFLAPTGGRATDVAPGRAKPMGDGRATEMPGLLGVAMGGRGVVALPAATGGGLHWEADERRTVGWPLSTEGAGVPGCAAAVNAEDP